MILPLMLGILVMVMSGCGRDQDDSSKFAEGSYQFTGANCETGVQRYATRAEVCRMLLDENLNHGCALSLRQSSHREYCGPNPARLPQGFGGGEGRVVPEPAAEQILIVGNALSGKSVERTFAADGKSVQSTVVLPFQLLEGVSNRDRRILGDQLILEYATKSLEGLSARCQERSRIEINDLTVEPGTAQQIRFSVSDPTSVPQEQSCYSQLTGVLQTGMKLTVRNALRVHARTRKSGKADVRVTLNPL